MSPQQLLGEDASVADDIYSLGATLYNLLTGKPPFYKGNIDLQIREKAPMPMAQRREALGGAGAPIPEAWECTVAMCLAKEPAQRPASIQEVAAALRDVAPANTSDAAVGRAPAKAPLPPASGPGTPYREIPKPAAPVAKSVALSDPPSALPEKSASSSQPPPPIAAIRSPSRDRSLDGPRKVPPAKMSSAAITATILGLFLLACLVLAWVL